MSDESSFDAFVDQVERVTGGYAPPPIGNDKLIEGSLQSPNQTAPGYADDVRRDPTTMFADYERERAIRQVQPQHVCNTMCSEAATIDASSRHEVAQLEHDSGITEQLIAAATTLATEGGSGAQEEAVAFLKSMWKSYVWEVEKPPLAGPTADGTGTWSIPKI